MCFVDGSPSNLLKKFFYCVILYVIMFKLMLTGNKYPPKAYRRDFESLEVHLLTCMYVKTSNIIMT